MPVYRSSFIIAGTHSGVGKTTLTLGLLCALKQQGLRVTPFKCGPDYIDPGYHGQACGGVSRNLDPWMMGEDGVRRSYANAAADGDVAVIEGVMGLYDGASASSIEGSTAHVARILNLPVILVVDAHSMARSIAALVHGYASFEPGLRLVGVIANNVASDSHTDLLREALAAAGLPPLLGCLRRCAEWEIPERHLGLVSDTENRKSETWFQRLGEWVKSCVDLDRLLACTRHDVGGPAIKTRADKNVTHPGAARLGLALDEAFHFYYEDNLDLLRAAGITLVPFSPLHAARLPEHLDGVYLGGGFPEMFAAGLAANEGMRLAFRTFAQDGGRIYAECGGLMYLCRTLKDREGQVYPMCGILAADTVMESRRRQLGYVEATTRLPGPLGPVGTTVRGHEFHWSSISDSGAAGLPCYDLCYRRSGQVEPHGWVFRQVWASYVHAHFMSHPGVAPAMCGWLRGPRPEGREEASG